jgi:hypothetical protein
MTKRKPTTNATPEQARELKAAGWVKGQRGLYWKRPGPKGGYYSPRGAVGLGHDLEACCDHALGVEGRELTPGGREGRASLTRRRRAA